MEAPVQQCAAPVQTIQAKNGPHAIPISEHGGCWPNPAGQNLVRWVRQRSVGYKPVFRNRRELAITETELKLIAAAAIIGDSNSPNAGNSTPAAMGTPSTL